VRDERNQDDTVEHRLQGRLGVGYPGVSAKVAIALTDVLETISGVRDLPTFVYGEIATNLGEGGVTS
jgi:hypothetical protein